MTSGTIMIELEDAVMEIIVNAGQSRSLCFEALHCARSGNIDEARLPADDPHYGACSGPSDEFAARA